MKVFVTGGAGYIGSFMVRALLDAGREVIVVDNLRRGHKDSIDHRAQFTEADIKDKSALEKIFTNNQVTCILHFAGLISVEESEKDPDLYYQNNVLGSKNLFDTALSYGVKKFIFSSTAAVYGNPEKIPIPEDHPKNPTSTYGITKLKIEEYLGSLAQESGVDYVCLRYFNAAGAALDGSMGENHNPETHIIPLAIRSAIADSEFYLYGDSYGTPDGTCIRDYIHVLDLVEAHMLALKKLESNRGGYQYNVGTGIGYSNKEVISMIEHVSSKKIKTKQAGRRAGDADRLIADAARIREDLKFAPKYSDLETIIKSAWIWHKSHI